SNLLTKNSGSTILIFVAISECLGCSPTAGWDAQKKKEKSFLAGEDETDWRRPGGDEKLAEIGTGGDEKLAEVGAGGDEKLAEIGAGGDLAEIGAGGDLAEIGAGG
ncbi:hypothetical protein LINPERPRIM_LOCUS36936, partial [Linum perenne]